jgi:hypothetical protein
MNPNIRRCHFLSQSFELHKVFTLVFLKLISLLYIFWYQEICQSIIHLYFYFSVKFHSHAKFSWHTIQIPNFNLHYKKVPVHVLLTLAAVKSAPWMCLLSITTGTELDTCFMPALDTTFCTYSTEGNRRLLSGVIKRYSQPDGLWKYVQLLTMSFGSYQHKYNFILSSENWNQTTKLNSPSKKKLNRK